MARVCEICGKKPITGNSISHAHNKTRRRWLPNLHTVKVIVNGEKKTIKVCTKCLKANKIVKAI